MRLERSLIVCTFVSVFCVAEAMLDMYSFNVGDANLFVLKKGKSVLFVDYGADKTAEFTTGKRNHELEILLKGAKTVECILTHDHVDHKNLRNVLEKITNNNAVFYNGWDDDISKIAFSRVVDLLYFQPGLDDDIKDLCVKINASSLILKINYAGKNILFTGDSTGSVLKRILVESNNTQYSSFIQDIDCLVFPHHGRMTDDSSFWYYTLKEISTINSPLLVLISACRTNVAKTIVETWHCNRGTNSGKTVKHALFSDDADFEYPVFITSNAKKYYKLTIDSDGIMKLTNNDRDVLYYQ